MRRIFLAGFLIMAVWVVWGAFFAPTEEILKTPISSDENLNNTKIPSNGKETVESEDLELLKTEEAGELVNFTIKTPLFTADLSNKLGGTFLQYTLNDNKYKGAYTEESSKYDNKDKRHSYDKGAPVSLMFSEDEGFVACNPCLGGVETFGLHEVLVDGAPFSGVLKDITKETVIEFKSDDFIHKITVDPGSYKVLHEYQILSESLKQKFPKLVWANGTRPAEKYGWLDDQSSYGMYLTKNEEDSDYLTGNANQLDDALSFNQDIEWVASRNKYFVSAIAPAAGSSIRGGKIIPVPDSLFLNTYKYRGSNASVYNIEVEFENSSSFKFYTFMAPLKYSLVQESGVKGLDEIMTLGGSVFKPISKLVLSITNYLHSLIPFGGYALILVLFAFIVRIVAGPLTKLSLDSTRKMQEVQPIIKEIQEKYKDNPKKLQKKIMEAYKSHNVNPLSGCFLMLLQWPIMIPPFILFRSIIELRGEPLFFWIQDLSLPDYMFELPFHVPLLGIGNGYTGFGLLPILMGVTLFLTMKQSSGSMPQQNKVMLYTMNGMFVLLFNSFPAGLNLYYVVYNILNYFQQRRTSQNKSENGDGATAGPKPPFWTRFIKKK